ncbi:dihydropteroate synthase [Helicobacter suis]|uniref:dihydropteroate synthase n=1 Tax=Helicobacter suis TaxID=104628 RepID=UPI0024932F5D|nr:dihydropteroate synthase [Helicobacter suis]
MFLRRVNPKSFSLALQEIKVHKIGQEIMAKKGRLFSFKIEDLPLSATLILKQEALRVGAELATPKDCILAKKKTYNCLLVGTQDQLERLSQKCKEQDFGLKDLAQILEKHLKVAQIKPALMGVINLTPDSFYPNSRYSTKEALQTIQTFLQHKTSYIDIGAASSRPLSTYVDSHTEIARLKELCLEIKNQGLYQHIKFSIDTYNPKTAAFALEHGFAVLNDVNGFRDVQMLEIAKYYKPEVILMHSCGVPMDGTLLSAKDLWQDLEAFFTSKIEELSKSGVDRIILDIGFSFSKGTTQNLTLIQHLEHFLHFGYPLLVGCSRKGSIGEVCKQEVQDRLAGTLALHGLALAHGASILRVHDIPAHADLIAIHNALSCL